MKKILVPTDFSGNANNALKYAVRLANHFGATITLLHTFKVYSTTGMFISVERYMEEDAQASMEKVIRSVRPQLEGAAVIEQKLIRGDAIPMISSVADSGGYDLIIMGTQGASGLKEIFIGSVTNGVAKTAITPVLAVPTDFGYRDVKSVVFAVDDGRISSKTVVSALLDLAKGFDAKVMVYHKDLGDDDPGIDPSIHMFLEPIEYSLHYELNVDEINKSIGEFVEDKEGDLLCMIRRERGFLERIFHVSATSKEAFDSKVPLLILHDTQV
jgi:nucleotide-binding universal stress UspA family protein